MKKAVIVLLLILAAAGNVLSQDILVLKNGDEVKAKIVEIGTEEIKYKKFSMLDGPDFVCSKGDVFMIKFENGTKEVFGVTEAVLDDQSSPGEDEFATLYFIRPKRMSASRPEIIIGTVVPDEVILKLKNGRWHRLEYYNIGKVDFATGIYAINPEFFSYDIKAGETYYFYCEQEADGLKLMATMKLIEKEVAETYMASLKEQPTSLVK